MIKLLITLAAVAAIAAASASAAVEFPDLEDLYADGLQDDAVYDELDVADNVEDHLDQLVLQCRNENQCYQRAAAPVTDSAPKSSRNLQEDLQEVEEATESSVRRVCCLQGYYGSYPNQCRKCPGVSTSRAGPPTSVASIGISGMLRVSCPNAQQNQCFRCPPACFFLRTMESGERLCQPRFSCGGTQ